MKKLFFAFIFEKTIDIESVIQQLQIQLASDKIAWINPEKLHLTIKYLGDTKEEFIPKIIETTKEIIKDFSSFNIQSKTIKIFGSSYNQKIIWMDILQNQKIILLNQKIENQLINLGFLSDRQNYVPHITLGRIKKIKDKNYFKKCIQALDSTFLFSEEMQSFYLIENVLQKNNSSIYKPIAKFNI